MKVKAYKRQRIIYLWLIMFLSITFFVLTGLVLAEQARNDNPETASFSTGQILWERWEKVDGTAVSDLTQHHQFPENPSDTILTTSFEPPKNFGNNFGARARGFLFPPVTGEYTFWIAGDHSGELWLSTDDNPANVERIAFFESPTDEEQWDLFATQESVTIFLEAGERYYIEALHKESIGVEHIAVAWQTPDEPRMIISGEYLSPFLFPFRNIALDGTAEQSSTRPSLKNYEPENAIDGNTDGNSNNDSIAHTQNDLGAWWEVDLGEVSYIDAIRLWNRTDCCGERLQDFYLLISEEPFTSQLLTDTLEQDGVKAFYFADAADVTETFFTQTAGRHVRVQLTGQNFLQLAEVQVWSVDVAEETCGGLFQEAENGRLSGEFVVGADVDASNGFYAHTPEDTPTDFEAGLSNDFAEYCFNIENDGIYQINTRFYANGGANNSFFVTVDDLPADGIVWTVEPNAIYTEGFVQEVGALQPYTVTLDAGEHFVTFYQREDGARLDWVELVQINSSPVVTSPGDQENIIGNAVSLQINATDPDDDSLTYGAENLPDGLTIEPITGLISGTVTKIGLFDVTIRVDDGESGPSEIMFQWMVSDVPNTPPMLAEIDEQTNTVGDTVSLPIVATDVNSDTLTFDAEGLPEGLAIGTVDGVISGTVTAVSINEVTITVEDGQGGSDMATFTWTVNEEPNEPPAAINPGAQLNEEGETVSLFISANDPDADALTYAAEGLPDGLSINNTTGEIGGTLLKADTYLVVVTISDGRLTTEVRFAWQVDAAPEIFMSYLPALWNDVRLDEPNNACEEAHPLAFNLPSHFLHEDMEDWYRLTRSNSGDLRVVLSNFTGEGQLIVYSGSCDTLQFLQNNGNFDPTKIIDLGNVPAGTYFIRVITDSGYDDLTPYTLLVE